MANMLFSTRMVCDFWTQNTNLVSKYYNTLINFGFEEAARCMKELVRSTEDRIFASGDALEDSFYNDMFLCKTFSEFLETYSGYWSKLENNDYPESWSRLQDALQLLRTLNRFSSINKTRAFSFFEKQLQGLEILYPYKVFASTEITVGCVECSICQNNIDSLGCCHIQGELYRGQIAFGKVKEIKDFLSVSLVENPADKRCVMNEINGKPIQFPCVEYLAQHLCRRKVNPLMISHANQTTRKKPVIEEKLPRNDKCPCGSGKKFKKCCINKTIDTPHVEIILKDCNGFSVEDLIAMKVV